MRLFLVIMTTFAQERRADGGALVTSEFELPVTRFNRVLRRGEKPKLLDHYRLWMEFDWFIDVNYKWKQDLDDHEMVIVERFNRPRNEYPRTVWCILTEFEHCMGLLEQQFSPDPAGRVVVISGQDKPWLSKVPKMHNYSKWFEGIRFENKDVRDKRIAASFMGLSEHYYRQHETQMFHAINVATLNKTQLAFAAWGEFWKFLDKTKPRSQLQAWIQNSHWVERIHVARELWFETVGSSKFLIQPLGQSMQTPKLVEALLVLTVPVVESVPCHDDLLREGWPIVVVNAWHELTPEFLEDEWRRLAPRLVQFRKDYLLGRGFFEMLTTVPPSL